jgi:hypothetical protein
VPFTTAFIFSQRITLLKAAWQREKTVGGEIEALSHTDKKGGHRNDDRLFAGSLNLTGSSARANTDLQKTLRQRGQAHLSHLRGRVD